MNFNGYGAQTKTMENHPVVKKKTNKHLKSFHLFTFFFKLTANQPLRHFPPWAPCLPSAPQINLCYQRTMKSISDFFFKVAKASSKTYLGQEIHGLIRSSFYTPVFLILTILQKHIWIKTYASRIKTHRVF